MSSYAIATWPFGCSQPIYLVGFDVDHFDSFECFRLAQKRVDVFEAFRYLELLVSLNRYPTETGYECLCFLTGRRNRGMSNLPRSCEAYKSVGVLPSICYKGIHSDVEDILIVV